VTNLFVLQGPREHVRSDDRPDSTATAVQTCIVAVGARTAFIEQSSPWENGYRESFGF
jgi:hypothetical protein